MVLADQIVIRRLICSRWCTHMAGNWCWPSAGSQIGATQFSSMWPLHLLGLLTVQQLGSSGEHSQHLEAEAAALFRNRLESSTVKISTTFYWSKLEPTTLRGWGAKNLCYLLPTMSTILKKGWQQHNDFSVTYSKCLTYKCQNEVSWLCPTLSKKWAYQWIYRSGNTKNGRYWLGRDANFYICLQEPSFA